MLALSNLGFWFLSSFYYNEPFLYAVIILENFSSGLTTTALVALLMKIVNPQYTASQFSFWVIFGVVPRIMAAPLVGVLFPHTGWSGLFLLSTLICASFVYFWLKVKKELKAV
jgi:PAT family beta-lactamase induction signal transducer AmpG